MHALPNLHLSKNGIFESEYIAIVPANDSRLEYPPDIEKFNAACLLQKYFKTIIGKPIQPSALITKQNISADILKIDCLKAFRNICAFSSLLSARAKLILDGNLSNTQYSDFFNIFPFEPSENGIGLISPESLILGYDTRTVFSFQPAPYIGDPSKYEVNKNARMWDLLYKGWETFYIKKKFRRKISRVFRSLNIVYHATSFPLYGLVGIYDIGIKLGLWVSAFEILLKPDDREINRNIVLDYIRDSIKWKSAKVKMSVYNYKNRKGRVIRQLSLP